MLNGCDFKWKGQVTSLLLLKDHPLSQTLILDPHKEQWSSSCVLSAAHSFWQMQAALKHHLLIGGPIASHWPLVSDILLDCIMSSMSIFTCYSVICHFHKRFQFCWKKILHAGVAVKEAKKGFRNYSQAGCKEAKHPENAFTQVPEGHVPHGDFVRTVSRTLCNIFRKCLFWIAIIENLDKENLFLPSKA